jgi:hypothetical protein
MGDVEGSDRSPRCDVEKAGTGHAGRWELTAWVNVAKPKCWQIEIERSNSFFSDFSFGISGPEIIDDALLFIQQTIGLIQYSDSSIEIESHEVRPFVCPKLSVGRFAGIPVELFKDGAEDRYFLVAALTGQGAIRFVILGEELRDFVDALRRLSENVRVWAAEPSGGANSA